jgi:hypothetical protein
VDRRTFLKTGFVGSALGVTGLGCAGDNTDAGSIIAGGVEIEGPLASQFAALKDAANAPDVRSLFLDLDPPLQSFVDRAPLEDPPSPFVPTPPTEQERAELIEMVPGLIAELNETLELGLSSDDLGAAQEQVERSVFAFLEAAVTELEQVRTLYVPLNLAAAPIATVTSARTFVFMSASGSNLVLADLLSDETIKWAAKALIIAGILISIIEFILALLKIRVNIPADEVVDKVSDKLPILLPLVRDLLTKLGREGATAGEIVSAIFTLLRSLYRNGVLGDVLKAAFTSLGPLDLLCTIASIVLLILSGGSSAVVSAGYSVAKLVVALGGFSLGMYKIQEE